MASVADGRRVVSTAGTRVRLVSLATPARGVAVQALHSNGDKVAVGGATVVAAAGSETGAVLGPGMSVAIPCDDLFDVYVDAQTSGEGVSYVAVVA